MEIVIVYSFVEINGIIGSFDDDTIFLETILFNKTVQL